MTPEFYRADGDWTPLRLGRVGWFLAGAGFPHEFQGVEDAELPFFKVGDTNLPGNEQELRSAPNTVSRLTARQLGARICPAGAIAFPKVGATLLGNKRRLTVRDCIFDNNMMALVPRAEHDPRFLLYALGDLDFGQLSNPGPVPSINAGDLKDVFLPIPAPRMQRAIAAFLDRKTAAIDALIAKKERLIELLQEKRQAMITQAVTKGLNPKAPMKESRVEWIGLVPAHWKVARVKHVAKLESGHTPSRSVPDHWLDSNDIPWVSLNDTKTLAKNDYISETVHCINKLGLQNSSAHMLPARIVVFTRDATIGKAAITTRPMAVSQHIIAWVCGSKIDPEYLLRVFYGMEKFLDRFTFGATIKTIGMGDVGKLVTPVPPRDEQAAIVDFVCRQVRSFDVLTEKLEAQVTNLVEYRQALITAAVTGKIDVSKEAA